MRLQARAILASVLTLSFAAMAAPPQGDAPGPDEWSHEGDTDGDGLRDDFESRHGLDPSKVESYPDGIADEHRLASATVTMWDAQKAEEEQPAASMSGGGGAGCGATGLETLLLLVLLPLIRSGKRRYDKVSRFIYHIGPI